MVIKKYLCNWRLLYRKSQVTFKVSPTSLQTFLTRQTVFSKTVFSIVRSTFRMYSVMAIFKSSIVWGLFEYIKSGAQRLFEHPVRLGVNRCWFLLILNIIIINIAPRTEHTSKLFIFLISSYSRDVDEIWITTLGSVTSQKRAYIIYNHLLCRHLPPWYFYISIYFSHFNIQGKSVFYFWTTWKKIANFQHYFQLCSSQN